jgi:hypothetical protein
MKTYVCTNCGKNFGQKGHYDAHCARKNPCKRAGAGVEGNLVLELKREIDELKKTVSALQLLVSSGSTQQNSVTVGNNNTTTNVTNNQVYISNFGADDNKFLSQAELRDITSDVYNKLFIRYVEKVNCNAAFPQNHNIFVPNLRANYVHVFTNGVWKTMPKKEAIDKFVECKQVELIDLCADERVTSLPKSLKENLDATVEDDDDDSLLERPKQVEHLLYTHSKMIGNTKRNHQNAG